MSWAVAEGAAALGAALYRAYFATLRVQGLLAGGVVVDPAEYPFGREIFALCERDALALAGIIAYTRLTALVALGWDGDWASGVLARLGYGVIRGSSLRSGAGALIRLIRTMRAAAAPVAIVVDGPLGPSGEAKPGIVRCAQRTGRPIRALGVAARRRIVFRSTWSELFLPLPCSRVVVACEDPLSIPASADRAVVADLTLELNARLARAQERALAALVRPAVRNPSADAAPKPGSPNGGPGATGGAQRALDASLTRPVGERR